MTVQPLTRGDVVLTRFPFTDLKGSRLRPAVVVSQGQIGQDVVLAAISSVVRGSLAPTDCAIEMTHPEFAMTGLAVQEFRSQDPISFMVGDGSNWVHAIVVRPEDQEALGTSR